MNLTELINSKRNTPIGKNKLIFWVIAIVCAIILCGVITLIVLLNINNPIKKFKNALLSKTNNAVTIYINNQENADFILQAHDLMEEYFLGLQSDVAIGEISIDDFLNNINMLSTIYDNSNEMILFAENLKISNDAYYAGIFAQENNDYCSAIDEYKAVAEYDTQYYSIAQENISICYKLFAEDEIAKANEFVTKDEYDRAIKSLEAAIKTGYADDTVSERLVTVKEEKKNYLCEKAIAKAEAAGNLIEAYKILLDVPFNERNEALVEEMDSTVLQAQKYVITELEDFISQKKYIEALDYYKQLPTTIKSDTTITSLKENAETAYSEEQIGLAEKKIASGDYQGAISIMDRAHKNINLNLFKTKRKEYGQMYINSVKGKIDYYYDYFDKLYGIAFYGNNPQYVEINDSRNVDSVIAYLNDKVYFRLTLGFCDDDWIFMDKIIVDCDGDQFVYNVKWSDRNSEVMGGKIYEWYTISTNKEYIEDLIFFMKTSSKVSVRFEGSDGHKDVVLPSSHVKELVSLWDLYDILKDDPSTTLSLVS